MSLRIKHKNVRISTDKDGESVVEVYIKNVRKFAYIDLEDYLHVVEEFPDSPWFAAHNGAGTRYVRLKEPIIGRIFLVARLITGEAPRTKVCYRDGDPFNLRRSNLYTTSGNGMRRGDRVAPALRADRSGTDE